MTPALSIAIGSDELGTDLRELLIKHVAARGVTLTDFGTETDYPVIAQRVAAAVAAGAYDRAVLICGTGNGVCIVANKFVGVYAVKAHDVTSARRAITSNAAQILCLGALIIGPAAAYEVLDAWLDTDLETGPRSPKVAQIHELEQLLYR